MKEVFLLIEVSDYEDEMNRILKSFPSKEVLAAYMEKENLHFKGEFEESGLSWVKVDFIDKV